jgi:hypothetical protein
LLDGKLARLRFHFDGKTFFIAFSINITDAAVDPWGETDSSTNRVSAERLESRVSPQELASSTT